MPGGNHCSVVALSHCSYRCVCLYVCVCVCVCDLLLAIEEEETTEIILGSEKGWILWTCRVFVCT